MFKQNWSIHIGHENAECYKQTIIALGYSWCDFCEGFRDNKYIRSDEANNNKVFFSGMTEDDHFEDIEEFLKWHFNPRKTEAQLKIEELQATIDKAQRELQELKEMK